MKYLIIFIVMLLIIAVITVVLIRKVLPKMIIKELEQYENDLVGRQFDEIRNTYYEMRGWRHDYKNHMQVLKAYIDEQQWEACESYIAQMDIDLGSVDNVIKTGNVMADAIVNSKASLAKSKDITLNLTAHVPEKLPISDLEFCVIFGNLMDNAIEACDKVSDHSKKFIRVYIGLFKKQFYISVTNATNEKQRTKKYYSIKGEGHGFGLYRIDKIVQEHNGYLNRKNEPGVFATELLLPFMPK